MCKAFPDLFAFGRTSVCVLTPPSLASERSGVCEGGGVCVCEGRGCVCEGEGVCVCVRYTNGESMHFGKADSAAVCIILCLYL